MPECHDGAYCYMTEGSNKEPDNPWGIYWNAVMEINRKFGGKESNKERMYAFLDNCQLPVCAGFAESYVKLFEPNRSFSINLLKPLQVESYNHFKHTKNPEETKELKRNI